MSDANTVEERSAREARAASDTEMTAEQLAEARRYGRAQLACDLADKGIDLAYLGLVAFLFARPLDAWLHALLPNDSLRLVALYLVTMLIYECVSLPLSFYSGHVLEQRFGLSTQSAGAWVARHFKRYGVAVGFGLVMFFALFWVIWLCGGYWWLVASCAFFVVSVVLGQLTPVLILPLFYKIERLDDAELGQRMQRLAAGTGLSIEGVYRMSLSQETAKANAMLAGLGRTRRVILGDTLLSEFSHDEIEVILAHEIGHHVHRHLPKMIAAGALFSLAGFWVCDRLVAAWRGVDDPATMPVYALPMLLFGLTAVAMVLEPLQNIISRRYERQCDRYALARTGLKAAYISAFRKLAKQNKDDPAPNAVEVFLFHSHPPIAQRLALAEDAS